MSEFSHFNLYGTLLEVKDAIARKSITELVATCGSLRDITNNLLEKSLNHDENIADILTDIDSINGVIEDIEKTIDGLDGDVSALENEVADISSNLENLRDENIADILTDIDSINGAIEDIEKTIDELDGDVSALENEVADISSNLENLRIVVNADNETETYEYKDETYGIKVTFYRRGKNVLMFLRTLSGLLAELPTHSKYFTLLTIPTQFRPAIDTIMTRTFSTIYEGQLNISQTIKIGYCYRINYVTYDRRAETISYARETVPINLPKGFTFYYHDTWVVN